MSTVTLKVSDRVLKRATELAEIAGVSVDRMLEIMLDRIVPTPMSAHDLPPNTKALVGILVNRGSGSEVLNDFDETKLSANARAALGLFKTAVNQDKSYEEWRDEALQEKYG